MIKQRYERYALSAASIDAISELCFQALSEAECDRKDIIRIRLSLEEILGFWLKDLSGAEVRCKTGQKFGRLYVEFGVVGNKVEVNVDDGSENFLLSSRLLSQAGLSLLYSYKDGVNCLTLALPKKANIGQTKWLLIAILLSIITGLLLKTLPAAFSDTTDLIITPLFKTILGGLRALSSPMVFFSICWGIVSIEDLATVEKVGKVLIKRMILETFFIGFITAILTAFFFPVVVTESTSKNGQTGFAQGFLDIYQMILDIVPHDIISPFLQGNALQIIFMGACVGIALLVLGGRSVSSMQNVVGQANEIVQFLIGLLSRSMPIFVFLSILHLLLSDFVAVFFSIAKLFCIALPCTLLLLFSYILLVSIRYRISVLRVIKKLFPTFLIGITTASSAAAFSVNLETCEMRLGIPKKLANFAIPLGQVVFMPCDVVVDFIIAICMAEYYQVQITSIWIVTAVLTVGLLAIATPPIPGGGLSVFTVLFMQLHIPVEALAMVVAVNSVFDFITTAVNLSCLQLELTLGVGSLKMLRTEKLES